MLNPQESIIQHVISNLEEAGVRILSLLRDIMGERVVRFFIPDSGMSAA
jgi:hypothetical protein